METGQNRNIYGHLSRTVPALPGAEWRARGGGAGAIGEVMGKDFIGKGAGAGSESSARGHGSVADYGS